MSMSAHELDAESAELLPGREALGRMKFSFHKTVNVKKHIANVWAQNQSQAINDHSAWSSAESQAVQSITINQ
ncbi:MULTISPECIES: hypothetical protein [unclassified Streptomyces]|uniref:hypothetical protein n=1 Tax=unclassified Streptomyces TaxID=2593676 RepID=UPI003D9332DD